jgi:PAS domain S-box-containing protein
MQNEELRRTEAAAKELRDQYNAAHEQAEKVAREAAELHRTLVERADIGITLIDPALNIVMANTKQAEFVGRNPDELVGKKCYCEYGGLDAICPDCQGLKAMASGIPAVSERTGTQKNGMAFAVRIKASPLFDRDGKPRGFIEVVEDISERKQAEEALAASEARYRKLFDEATEGIAVADAASGEIMDCNEAFSQLSGYQRHELIGKPQTMLHPAEEGNPQFSRSFAQHRKQDGAVLSAELLSKDGRIRQVEIKSNMLEIGGRQIMQGFFRDVTSETRHRRERETTLELMRLLNDDNHTHELVRNITGFLQQWTGCEAVGVRLRDGDDFPYFETRGFPAEFVQLENRL